MPGTVTWINQEIDLPKVPLEGFLRIVTDTPFRIWVNDAIVRPVTAHPSVLGYGPWFFREFSRSPFDIALDAPPESFNPNQTATLVPGRQRESPSGRDRAGNNFSPDEFSAGGTINHPATNGNRVSSSYSSKGGPSQFADPQNPDRVVPPVLTRNRRRTEFVAYSITSLLKEGKNKIRIGVYKDEPQAADLSQQPFLAFDGGALLFGGDQVSFSSGETTLSSTDRLGETKRADVDGTIEPKLLPDKEVFGYSYPDRPWFSVALAIFIVCAGSLLLASAASSSIVWLILTCRSPSALVAGWIGGGLLLRSAMLERSEALYWRLAAAPLALLATGAAGALLSFVLVRWTLQKRSRASPSTRIELPSKNPQPRTWVWRVLVGAGIALCFILRAWQIDLQPPDEDEFASIQASLAIAQKGAPEYQEGVWYTRSPAYHYLAGAVAALTGSNIYTLRLLTVLFSCATALLIWQLARELTHTRFLAFCALILFALHPFLVFTGHVARFYQQQQFFHLLVLYFFIRGFIANSGMRDRYLTIAVFFVATFAPALDS